MKKCPKCKAEIQENARFCLYCMTSFEEKQTIETPKENNKRWLYIIAAVLVFALVFLSIFLFIPKENRSNGSNDNSSNTSISSDLDISADNGTTSREQQNSESESGNSQNNTTTNNTTTNNISANNATAGFSSSSNKTENYKSDNSSATTTTPSVTTTVTYSYRNAKYGDDFSVSTNLENCVVITGVKTASANGEYKIPDTIDGKKVIAIMALAFCDDSIHNTVKKVIVPSTVKTIWNNAFANCYYLTDIYFCGNSIYTEANAFPESSKRNGTLTIHCSENCSDRNFRYYKNSASNYDAEYAEWNG